MKKLGYLGLGSVGTGMAANLAAKYNGSVTGYDPVAELRERFRENGGTAAGSAEEIYRSCDLIFLCLPTNEAMSETIDEILKYAEQGTIICDMGSTSPHIVREMYDAASSKGVQLLDTPVSGGKAGADAGTLAIMCGGEKGVFETARPYLEMMGSTVTYMGQSGCGSIAKLANNMMVGIHLAAIGEAFAFAKKAGLDPQTLFEAIKNGFAQSAAMDEKVPKILKRDFEPTARTAVHMKDIKNAVELSEKIGANIPLTSIVMDDMQWMQQQGMINEDHCAMVKYFEEMMNVIID